MFVQFRHITSRGKPKFWCSCSGMQTFLKWVPLSNSMKTLVNCGVPLQSGHLRTRQQFSYVWIVRHNYGPLAGLVVQWFVLIPVFIVSHLKCFAKDYRVLNLFVVPELYFLSFHYLQNRAEGLVCKVFKMYFSWLNWRWMAWILFKCWEPVILFVWKSIISLFLISCL